MARSLVALGLVALGLVALGLVALGLVAACSSSPPAPPPRSVDAAATAVVAPPTPPPVAPAAPRTPPEPAFDFRAVELAPDEYVGTTQVCDVLSLGHKAPAPGVIEVRCSNGYTGIPVHVTVEGDATIAAREIIALRVTGGRDREAGAAATATLGERLGELPEPPRPSRCCRDRDREREEEANRETAERHARAYDFALVKDDRSVWGTTRECLVQSQPSELVKSDATADRYKLAAMFPPDVAPYAGRILCSGAGGATLVDVGFTSLEQALSVQDEMMLRLELHWLGTPYRPSAVMRGVSHWVSAPHHR